MPKSNVPEAELRADFGLVGDAHAGSGHRQVSLLAVESIEGSGRKGWRSRRAISPRISRWKAWTCPL